MHDAFPRQTPRPKLHSYDPRQKAQSIDLLRQLLFQADGSKPRSPAGLAAEPARICNRVLLRLQEGVEDEYNIQVRWGYGTLGHQDCKAVGGLGVGDTHMDSNNEHWHDHGSKPAGIHGSKPAGMHGSKPGHTAHQGRPRQYCRCHARVPPSRGTLLVPTERMLPSVHQRRGFRRSLKFQLLCNPNSSSPRKGRQ